MKPYKSPSASTVISLHCGLCGKWFKASREAVQRLGKEHFGQSISGHIAYDDGGLTNYAFFATNTKHDICSECFSAILLHLAESYSKVCSRNMNIPLDPLENTDG